MIRKHLRRLTIAGALMALASIASADFPERTVELIFPWSAGTAMANSQIIANAMAEELGESMPVISTPGAAGTKAFITAMNKPADGYTVIDGYVAPLVLQPILGNADWTYKDFKPLHSGVSNAFSIGVRNGDKRFSNFEELMAYGQANPGKMRYSSGSRNNLPHMVMAKVLQSYNVVAQNIPYSTDNDARKDLKSGVLDFVFINIGTYLADKDGYNVVLVLSELPGAKEQYDGKLSIADLDIDLGLTGLAPMGWDWWLVHKDTPDDVYQRLNEAMTAVMQDEEIRARFSATGYVPLEWSSDEYEEQVSVVVEQLTAMGDALAWEEAELKKLKQ